jgi:uncharacterized oligopeptide transporter (OPT) family protein
MSTTGIILIITFYAVVAITAFIANDEESISIRTTTSVFWPILVCMTFIYVIFGILVLIFCNFLWRLVLGSWELIKTIPTTFAEIFNEYKYDNR